jgi:hypothetical protein
MKRSLSHFSPDYFTAKDRFRHAAANAGARMEALRLEAKGPNGEELGIDIAWFGSDTPRRVLLHSSGLHGVEGFAGSAIQLQLLDQLPALPADTALIVVHTLNPYGMAWLRRTNENNVDLNRNFKIDGSYKGAPAAYTKLDSFLNPRTPPAFDFYLAKAIGLICRHGMSALKQSVVGGQYEYPKGLFFGGKHLEEGPRQYVAFLTAHLSSAERCVAIEVHTGIGKYAQDLLFVQSEDFDRLRRTIGERVTAPEPDRGPGYRIEGGLESMIFDTFSKAHPTFFCQEFGTYSPTKVLHALREENRWHHYGRGSMDDATKRKIKETFCPADEAWRESVLHRGQELIGHAIAELTHDR